MPRKLLSRAQSSIKPKERKAAIEESAGRQTKAEPEGRCPSCRHELPEGSTFCPSCGAHLASHEPSKKESRRKRKKRAEVEAKRIGGTAALSCANELAGFELMYRSGLCESAKGVFSFTLEFSDISYEHERKDVKDDIFCKLCELHSIFGPGTVYQMNLLNLPNARYDAERYLPEEGADAKWASAYNDLLEERQKKGRVEFERRNLLTIAVTASDDEEAKRKLGSMAESATLALSRMRSKARRLDGTERMRLMHTLLRGPGEPYTFEWSKLEGTGLRAADFVAPSWAAYGPNDRSMRAALTLPGRYVRTYHIKDFGSDLSDRAIRSIRSLPIPMNISLLFRPQVTSKVVRAIRENMNSIQAEMLDISQSVAKAGGDPTRMPPSLEERESDTLELLDHIRDDDQQVSWYQGLITVFAEDEERMAVYDQLLSDEMGKWTIDLTQMPTQQESALPSSLPLATPRLDSRYRSLTTAECATMVPYQSQNIHDDPKTSYMLGQDTVSGDAILVDPDKTKSPHMWLFGMTGGGKGMTMKSFLSYSIFQHPRTAVSEADGSPVCADARCPEWHIIDFHREYVELTEEFGGTVGHFGPGLDGCLNPMDMGSISGKLTAKNVMENADFFLALMGSVLGRELNHTEKTIIDRAIHASFKPHLGKASRPTLEKLHKALLAETGEGASEVAQQLACQLELYVKGSLSSFNGRSNFKTSTYLNCYDFAECGTQMQTLALLSALQHVRNRAFANHRAGRATHLVLSLIHI